MFIFNSTIYIYYYVEFNQIIGNKKQKGEEKKMKKEEGAERVIWISDSMM